jgi:hypothetical protein
MLNASFCGVDDITADDAIKLQDHNMLLHGNDVVEVHWAYSRQKNYDLRVIPTWLRTLEKVTYANLQFCAIKEIKGGALPASLERLDINNQAHPGLRLHPDSFEGLVNLRFLGVWGAGGGLTGNFLTDADMHQGLFRDTRLKQLGIGANIFAKFNATKLGLRGQPLVHLDLIEGSLAGVGEERGSDFRGLAMLRALDIGRNNIGSIAVDAFEGERPTHWLFVFARLPLFAQVSAVSLIFTRVGTTSPLWKLACSTTRGISNGSILKTTRSSHSRRACSGELWLWILT